MFIEDRLRTFSVKVLLVKSQAGEEQEMRSLLNFFG